MSRARILFRNWIAEMGVDPWRVEAGHEERRHGADDSLQREIIEQVTAALERLTESERELVRQYHFQGRSLRAIAEMTGRRQYRLEALLARATRKLRSLLAPYVAERFGVDATQDYETDDTGNRPCPICRSDKRAQIEKVIGERKEQETWGPIIRIIREKLGVRIVSPQQIIGHIKYHAPLKRPQDLTNTEYS